MKKSDLISGLVWVGLGIAVTVMAVHKFGLGTLRKPGAGLMPFCLGIILTGCALYLVLRSLRTKGSQATGGVWSGVEFRRLILVLASLLAAIVFFEKLGFALTTFLLLILLFRAVDARRWRSALITSLITVIATYLVFVTLLKWICLPGF